MSSKFSQLFSLAGTSFVVTGFLARLPVAMLTIGVLTFVSSASDNYALGGLAGGAVGLGSALGAPLAGYLADRVGQRPVLLASGVGNAVVIALLITWVLSTGTSGPVHVLITVALAFFAGASAPQASPMARVRWMALTANTQGRLLPTALSYESTADELTFVLGPALVGVLASVFPTWLPLALAALLSLGAVGGFALHPSATLTSGTNRSTAHARVKMSAWARIGIPVLGMVCIGTFFGATSAGVVSFAGAHGNPGAGGLFYAAMGLTSAIAALSVAFWPPSWHLQLRWLCCALALALSILLLPGATSAFHLVLVLLLLGVFVGPCMVTMFSVGAHLAPAHLLSTTMTLFSSGIVAGTAIGSSLAGGFAETSGPGRALLVSVVAAFALAIFALLNVLATPRGTGQASG